MKEGTWLDRNYMTSLMDASGARYGVYVMDRTNYTNYAIGEADTPSSGICIGFGIPIMYTIAEGIDRGATGMDHAHQIFVYVSKWTGIYSTAKWTDADDKRTAGGRPDIQ